MKNSLYIDLVNECIRKLEEHNDFSILYGGKMDKEQKEKFKAKLNEFIDRI